MQKKRTFRSFKKKNLVFGDVGLKLMSALLIDSKQIFRLKLYLKKAAKRSDATKRRVWFHAFPHLPLSKKAKGNRMGKGVGKLDLWFVHLNAGIFLVEFKNLRPGRARFFMRQVSHRLPGLTQAYFKLNRTLTLTAARRTNCSATLFY